MPKPKLNVLTNRPKLTADQIDAILDAAVDAAETELIPMLLERSSSDVYSAFLQHIHSHMTQELAYIKNGKGLDVDPAGSAVQKLRDRFLELKNK